jgi:rod shape-determining protein MreB
MAREQRIRSFSSQSQKQELSIDVGSTFTRVKIADKIVFDEPTCLAVRRGSDIVVAIGKKAYQLLGKNTAQIEVIFPVQYAATASTTYFDFFMQALGSQLHTSKSWFSQFSNNTVLVGVPDSLSPVERAQFLKGIKSTHFGKVVPVSAGLAAASNLNRLDTSGAPVCLVHIGGQTTQISVLAGGEVISSTKFQLGGMMFTEVVQETIRNHEQCGVSWHLAELIKKEIAYIDSPILARSLKQKKMSVQGKDITTQLGKTVVVASEHFLPGFETVLSDLVINIRLFFAQLPTEIATTAIASGLVLTGGSSVIVGLSEFLSAELQTEVFVSPTPDHDVVLGVSSV